MTEGSFSPVPLVSLLSQPPGTRSQCKGGPRASDLDSRRTGWRLRASCACSSCRTNTQRQRETQLGLGQRSAAGLGPLVQPRAGVVPSCCCNTVFVLPLASCRCPIRLLGHQKDIGSGGCFPEGLCVHTGRNACPDGAGHPGAKVYAALWRWRRVGREPSIS